MNLEPTHQKLKDLRLKAMSDSLEARMERNEHRELTPEEFFALIVEDEYHARKSRRFNTMIKKADLRPENPCLENIRYEQQRGFAKKDLYEFTDSKWIDNAKNVILTGPTGVGKTYLGESLIFQGCKLGFAGRKITQNLLLEETMVARATGKLIKYLKDVQRTKVLVLDDFLINKLNSDSASEILMFLEERVMRCPTIVTSQYPTDKWHGRISDSTIADAICDRLLVGTIRINLKGQSQRNK